MKVGEDAGLPWVDREWFAGGARVGRERVGAGSRVGHGRGVAAAHGRTKVRCAL